MWHTDKDWYCFYILSSSRFTITAIVSLPLTWETCQFGCIKIHILFALVNLHNGALLILFFLFFFSCPSFQWLWQLNWKMPKVNLVQADKETAIKRDVASVQAVYCVSTERKHSAFQLVWIRTSFLMWEISWGLLEYLCWLTPCVVKNFFFMFWRKKLVVFPPLSPGTCGEQ